MVRGENKVMKCIIANIVDDFMPTIIVIMFDGDVYATRIVHYNRYYRYSYTIDFVSNSLNTCTRMM